MGLLDLFARDVACPRCGNPEARKSFFGGVRCPNRGCELFDAALMNEREARRAYRPEPAAQADGMQRYRDPRTGRKRVAVVGEFDPGAYRIEIRYENFRGEAKTFVGDRRTLVRRGKHLSLRVMPTGTRIALDRARIGNVAEVESAVGREPTGRECRVLLYHAARGTTSELCERLRQKYPDWVPPG